MVTHTLAHSTTQNNEESSDIAANRRLQHAMRREVARYRQEKEVYRRLKEAISYLLPYWPRQLPTHKQYLLARYLVLVLVLSEDYPSDIADKAVYGLRLLAGDPNAVLEEPIWYVWEWSHLDWDDSFTYRNWWTKLARGFGPEVIKQFRALLRGHEASHAN